MARSSFMQIPRPRPLLLFTVWVFAHSFFAMAENQMPRFDADRAWFFLTQQVDYGPRVPGAQAHKKTQELIISTLSASGFSTHTQRFRAYAPLLGKEVEGTNLYGVKPPASQARYILSAHYDTRPRADMDPRPEYRTQPIPGANDGASGVAVLLAIAESLKGTTPPHPIALVFFDVEDSGIPQDVRSYCLGSQALADSLPTELLSMELGINIDMVGKKGLRIPMELYSLHAARSEVETLWDVGTRTAPSVFVKKEGRPIYDDHMPFLERGRKFINVIDFDYPQWHTMDDSIEQCSPQSLKAVGETLLRFLFQ